MNKTSEKASDRNFQQVNLNEGATLVAAAVVVFATLDNVRDVAVVELIMGALEIVLIDPVELSALGVVGEALSKAIKRFVSIAAALANEA